MCYQSLRVFLICSFFVLIFTGCLRDPEAEGIWKSEAYGQIYQFKATSQGYDSVRYLVTENYCLKDDTRHGLSLIDLAATIRRKGANLEIFDVGWRRGPGVVYKPLTELPIQCQKAVALKGEDNYQFNPLLDATIFWEAINQYFVDFGLTDVDWPQVWVQAKAELDNVTSEEELFELFVEMIAPLEDGHGIVLLGDLTQGIRDLVGEGEILEGYSFESERSYEARVYEEFVDTLNIAEDSEIFEEAFEVYLEQQLESTLDAIFTYADSEVHSAGDDNFVWFITEDNIGYLAITSMSGFGGDAYDLTYDLSQAESIIDNVLKDFEGVGGVIVDVRLNEGGEDEIALAIASRFMPATTHVYSKQARLGDSRTPKVDVYLEPEGKRQFLGDVAVLISTNTASAAEVFALSMRSLPNVSIIGERSAGAFSTILEKRVTSDIAFGFSNEFYLSPEGEWFERTGIPVDEEVFFSSLKQRNALEDMGIQMALDLLGM